MPQFIGAFFYLPQRKEEKVEVGQRVVFYKFLNYQANYNGKENDIILA
jgi:hypothetical protein